MKGNSVKYFVSVVRSCFKCYNALSVLCKFKASMALFACFHFCHFYFKLFLYYVTIPFIIGNACSPK